MDGEEDILSLFFFIDRIGAHTAGNTAESRRSITRKFPFPRSLYRADGRRRAAGSINAGGTNGNCECNGHRLIINARFRASATCLIIHLSFFFLKRSSPSITTILTEEESNKNRANIIKEG